MLSKNNQKLTDAVKTANEVLKTELVVKLEDALKLRRSNGKKKAQARAKRK